MSVKKGFLRNTVLMFAATFIVKLMGAVLKIPLGNILGGEGMGYFTTAFSIFAPVLAFTCSGVPAIVTQVTAKKISKGELGDIIHFRRSALFLAAFSGVIGTAVVYIAAIPFTCYIANSPESLLSVMIIAPSVFFCSVTAVYRGYYEGLSDMLPTAVSQVVESVVKAAVGVGLSYYVYGECVHKFGNEEQALPYAAAAAIFGVTVSELCGMLYVLFRSRRKDFSFPQKPVKSGFSVVLETAAEIFRESLPVAVGAVISNLFSFTDLLTVSNCINLSFSILPNQLAGGMLPMNELKGIDDPGNFLYGSYSGMVLSVYMLTASLSTLVARCSLPKLICTIELNRNDNGGMIKRDADIMLKGTILISAPISLFIAALAEPVLNILYPVRETEAAVSVIPLQILSAGGIFAAFGGTLLTILQAYGDFKTPVRIMMFSGLVKFVLNVVLMLIPGINITGAATATAISNSVAMLYALSKLKRLYGLKLSVRETAFPQLISASVSALAVFFAYKAFITEFSSIMSVIISCISGGLLYILILFIADSGELLEIIRSIRNKKIRKVL